MLGAHAALEGARLTTSAGIRAIAAKGTALGSYAIELIDAWLGVCGLMLAFPPRRPSPHVPRDTAPPAGVAAVASVAVGRRHGRPPPADLLRIGLAPL
jgi:kynureninase